MSEQPPKKKEAHIINAVPKFDEAKVAELKIFSKKFYNKALDAKYFFEKLERDFNEVYFIYQHYISEEKEYRPLKKILAEAIFVKLRLIEGTLSRLGVEPQADINSKVIGLRDAIAHHNERLEYYLLYKDRDHATIAQDDPDQNKVTPLRYQGDEITVNDNGGLNWKVTGDNYNLNLVHDNNGQVYIYSPLGIFNNKFIFMNQQGMIDYCNLDDALMGYYYKTITEYLNQFRVEVVKSGAFKGFLIEDYNKIDERIKQVMEEEFEKVERKRKQEL